MGLEIDPPPSNVSQLVIAWDLRAVEKSNATGGRISASNGLTSSKDDI